jgi:sulfonate transport system permease protein
LAIDQFKFSTQAAATLTGVQGGAFIVVLLFGGRLTSSGQKMPLVLSYWVTMLGLLCLGFTQTASGLWVGATFIGLGLGYLTIANLVKFTQLTHELGRGNIAGINGLAGPGGGLVGSIIGGALGHHIGLQTVFLILAGVYMVSSVIVLAKEQKFNSVFFKPVVKAPAWASLFKRTKSVGIAVILPLLLLLWWSISAQSQWVAPQILPAPERVAQRLLELIDKGDIQHHLSISFWRVLAGFFIGGIVGLLLGIAMGLSKTIEVYLNPLFKAFASVPGLAWVPLAILFCGIGEWLKFVLIALTCVVPVTINTLAGIRNVPVNFIEVGRVYRFSHWQMLQKVILPAALPPIFAGISLALNQAWQTLVAIELLASSEGIGFMMTWGRQLMQMEVVFTAIIVIGLVGLLLDKGLRAIEAHLLRWQPKTA